MFYTRNLETSSREKREEISGRAEINEINSKEEDERQTQEEHSQHSALTGSEEISWRVGLSRASILDAVTCCLWVLAVSVCSFVDPLREPLSVTH